MADIIQLLPDSIANQIAAGEVIQRPASVVKELMENSVDAGATEIRLILKDAGKTLVHVIDNGSGMSDTDLRMSFERHATSKIRSADDLFSIRTMGFRGEALASIAAIAHVDVATKQSSNELGSQIVIKGSKVIEQQPCQAHTGTSFAVKNLFYNVPARRKFLKSDAVELRHIIEEFQRLALAHTDIFFSLYHNDNEVYHLPPANVRQRIVALFGKQLNEEVVPISESTEMLSLSGFVSKPSYTKKRKGEQYIFVNNRFIKSAYLGHAVRMAYDEMISKDQHPLYVLYLEIDPAQIDINVHPTKTEIKFEEERVIYNYLRVAVKHALGQHQVTPSIDFSVDYNFGSRDQRSVPSSTPSGTGGGDTWSSSPRPPSRNSVDAWEQVYEGLRRDATSQVDTTPLTLGSKVDTSDHVDSSRQMVITDKREPHQVHNTYIVSHIKSGYMLIDQQAAHERILYEQYLRSIKEQSPVIQKELFPDTITLDPKRAQLLTSMLPQVNKMGFEVSEFGANSFIIYGTPAGLQHVEKSSDLLERVIDQYAANVDLKLGVDEAAARSLATSAAIKRGTKLDITEMMAIIDQLFACEVPYKSPAGGKCFIIQEMDDIRRLFVD
jgi:DNA mismatch repair protein MutL